MRLFVITFLSLSIFSGHKLTVIDATSEKYYPGRKESGKGIQYYIQVIPGKADSKISFDSLESSGYYSEIKILNSKKERIDQFDCKDTIIIYSAFHNKNIDIEKPVKLWYKLKNKQKQEQINVKNHEAVFRK